MTWHCPCFFFSRVTITLSQLVCGSILEILPQHHWRVELFEKVLETNEKKRERRWQRDERKKKSESRRCFYEQWFYCPAAEVSQMAERVWQSWARYEGRKALWISPRPMRMQLSITHWPRTFTLTGHGPLLIMKIQYVCITGCAYDSFELALIIILCG